MKNIILTKEKAKEIEKDINLMINLDSELLENKKYFISQQDAYSERNPTTFKNLLEEEQYKELSNRFAKLNDAQIVYLWVLVTMINQKKLSQKTDFSSFNNWLENSSVINDNNLTDEVWTERNNEKLESFLARKTAFILLKNSE